MELVTLDEFISEIETTFKNYSDTNDIDRISIKTWVINELRMFGKNICTKRETIADVKNARALLPETFRSLVLALKLSESDDVTGEPDVEKRLVLERQRIENPAEWSSVTRDYFVNNCETKIVTEKVYSHKEVQEKYYNTHFLSLMEGMQKDTLDVNCLNLHPSIRNNYPDKISITNRTLNTNFKEGKVYMQYNSLPCDENGEIAIPIISTGHIREYIENQVKIKIAEDLILGQKNPQGLISLLPLWNQSKRLFLIQAKSEANWNGFNQKEWAIKTQIENRARQNQYNLPR